MKKFLILLAAMALVGAGCASENVEETNSDQNNTSETTQNDSNQNDTTSTFVGEADVTLDMAVSDHEFQPTLIDAKVGDVVEITFDRVIGGPHTFVIDELGVRETVVEGKKIRFTVQEPAPGAAYFFRYYSDTEHDAGHSGMQGQVLAL